MLMEYWVQAYSSTRESNSDKVSALSVTLYTSTGIAKSDQAIIGSIGNMQKTYQQAECQAFCIGGQQEQLV